MKAVWENKFEISIEKDKLFILGTIDADLTTAYEIQSWISKKVQEMEQNERKKLPFWKRVL